MPIPTFTGLRPKPQFEDIVHKLNELADELTNLMLNLDTLNVVELDAKVIIAETITAAKIAANTITADKMNVTELSAISANLGKVVAGILIGAYISTADGTFPRIDFSSTNRLLEAFKDANNSIAISPTGSTDSPTLYFITSGMPSGYLSNVLGNLTLLSIGASNLNIGSAQDLKLYAGNYVRFDSWNAVMNSASGNTLQQDLNAKADAVSYSTTFDVIDSVDFVTQTTTSKTITITNGMITNVS